MSPAREPLQWLETHVSSSLGIDLALGAYVVRLRRVANPDEGQASDVNVRYHEHPLHGYFPPCWNGFVRRRGSLLGTKATMLFGVTPRTCAFGVTCEIAGTGVSSYCAGGGVPARATGLLEAR
ncbi:MAG TPA: hypothetical protein VMW58_10950 [Anaerolineae bacterium]|nr:hypothetical protein [Anaerolineae bacterium]